MGLHPLKSFDPRPLTENKEQHIRHETKTCNLTKYHRSQILHFPRGPNQSMVQLI